MVYICREVETEKEKELFLSLPQKLYTEYILTQDMTLERQILSGTHPLSKDFTIKPYIVVNTEDEIFARCVLTFYEDDSTAYIGFFESYDNFTAIESLFGRVIKECKKFSKEKIVGPYDCSFWIKYRFKVDNFDKHYTGEPYNLPYYKDLWERYGFKVSHKYYSNQMRVPTSEDSMEKAVLRLKQMQDRGYIFRNVSNKTFDSDFRNIYDLLVRLYSSFPGYRYISESDFISMFEKLKYILNYDMVFVAYKDDRLAGFLVCLPNYKDLTYDVGLLNIAQILRLRQNPKEFIILYMGAGKEHLGLNGAFSELVKRYLENHNCTSISALIKEGNYSGVYYRDLTVDKYNYVLMEYVLGSDNNVKS